MGRRLLLVSVLVACSLCLASCTGGRQFAHPAPWPGIPWTHDDHSVSTSVIDAAAGPSHCGWQSVTFLTMGWPLGTRAANAAQSREYVRDPKGLVGHFGLRSSLDLHATLPSDARSTGYVDGSARLYLAPSDDDVAAYIVQGATVERWPRSDPMTLCS